MTDAKPRPKLSNAQLRPMLPVLAALLLLAAGWLAWTGWQQARDTGRAQALEHRRGAAGVHGPSRHAAAGGVELRP